MMQMTVPPMQAMERCNRIEVQEKASLLEAASALIGQEIEMANRYNVFDDRGDKIFFAVESTDCCTRQLKQCAGDCAPWDVNILYVEGGDNEKAFQLHRDFSCTCLCFNRPIVEVSDASGNLLGTIKDTFSCIGNLTFTIRDPQEQEVMYARGGCCQPGLFCPMPCGPCSTVEFDVSDADGNHLGQIHKKVPNCFKFLFAPDVENYQVDLSGVKTAAEKVMLMALTIFIDFRYFSNNENDDQRGMNLSDAFSGDNE
eukprot:gnl/TRDRNA2_/TRDRNA2_80358_c0_seq1.p1 gnl/TRDRNA2_/TRDRNA2_80358_c0~~gnl/TRDRNA2_/TRDRNA2_80358_c0_seq1.p1  ORF type:complete len:256 (-),score=45.97 gnl/TRDRNA2_/TRDRNA2_80358_c0_seq1:169-936(-)